MHMYVCMCICACLCFVEKKKQNAEKINFKDRKQILQEQNFFLQFHLHCVP